MGKRLNRLAFVLVLAAAGGCATTSAPLRDDLSAATSPVRECAIWFSTLDAAIDRAGTRDAENSRIPGFPYLRSNRFLASFREDGVPDGESFAVWAGELRALDAQARGFELRNLPEASLRDLGVAGGEPAIARTEACAGELMRHDLADASARQLLRERAAVPDDYSDWKRAIGLYELTRIPFGRGVDRWHEEATDMIRQTRSGTGPARAYQRYAPPAAAGNAGGSAAEILGRASKDPLGIPRLSDAERERLLDLYAPVYEVETTGPHDRVGALAWNGATAPEVDASRPVVYRRLAHTRYGESTLVQLVYTVWFAERPPDGAFDMLAGKLDAVVLRVTLTPDGEPLVYDTIHACGCFHMFFPTPRAAPRPAPDAREEWAFVPVVLPRIGDGQRVVVRIASRTHYVLDIAPDAGEPAAQVYHWEDENQLRSLPYAGAGRRSAYGADGLVPGTERGERLLFWPMGIASAGAMRQWGRQATAFLGRRHFDDAELIALRFTIVQP